MYLILLGPPGAGKGTQAEILCRELNLPHVSSGGLFRDHLERETELGNLARTYIDVGHLVPDDVTIAMVKERLSRSDCNEGALLDGFPRTLAQAEALTPLLQELGQRIGAVLFIEIEDQVLIVRLSGRRTCRSCQAPYHIVFSPPIVADICDLCGGELYQREDDQAETIKARIAVYHRQTAPLIEHYRAADLLYEVAGDREIDDVTGALLAIIDGLHSDA